MTHSTLQSSCIYGPVRSWRLGISLGVDLLFVNSICSFRCIYCQLGKINLHTLERQVFMPTGQVMDSFQSSKWGDADVITFSGSGEPTLAANLGEVMTAIKELTFKPLVVLTNSTLLGDSGVRRELHLADQVFAKLDASDEQTFRQIDRPVTGLTLNKIIAGLVEFKQDYSGRLALQIMVQPKLLSQPAKLAAILREIQPHEVQLNSPLRPVPRKWHLAARGNETLPDYEYVKIKTVPSPVVEEFAGRLREMTGLKITTPNQPCCYPLSR